MFYTNSPALENCRYPNLVRLQEQNETVNRTRRCRPVPARCLPLLCRRIKHQGSLLVHEGFVKNLHLSTRRSKYKHLIHNISRRKQHPRHQTYPNVIFPHHPHSERLREADRTARSDQTTRSKLRPRYRPLITPTSTYLRCLCTATSLEGFHYTDK